MANYIESNEIVRPCRGSKRRGKQPDKLCVKLFLLDEDNDVTTISKGVRSKKELERLKRIGCGLPDTKFLNKDNKVEFQISMTTEEFKNKLVEIYPILQNKQFFLLKANEKCEVLERLNLAPSCYNPADIYHSSIGRRKLYIRCEKVIENFEIASGEPSSKKPRSLIAPESSSKVTPFPVYRGIRPKPKTQSSTIVPSISNITSSASVTTSTLSVGFNNPVPQQSSGVSAASNPGLGPGNIPTGITQSISLSAKPTPSTSITQPLTLISPVVQQSTHLNKGEGSGLCSGISMPKVTQPGILSSKQNNTNQNLTMSAVPKNTHLPNNNGISVDVLLNLMALLQKRQQQQQQTHQQQQQHQLQHQLQKQPQEQHQEMQQKQQHHLQYQLQHQLQHQLQQHLQQHLQLQQKPLQQHPELQQQNLQHQSQQQLHQQPTQYFPLQQPSIPSSFANAAPSSLGITNSFAPTVGSNQQNIASLGATLTTQSISKINTTNIGCQKNVPVGVSIPVRQSVTSPQSYQQLGPNIPVQQETFRNARSPLISFPNGPSETVVTSATSPLNALADVTVEQGPMNQEEDLTSNASNTNDSTSDFQENTSTSSSDDFDLDAFVEECQDTGHLVISPKFLKDRNRLERLQQLPSTTIHSIEIHKHCKLSEVLEVFSFPTSLKVLTIKENCLDDSDIEILVIGVVLKLSKLEELDLSNTIFLSNIRLLFISSLVKLTSLKRLCLYNNSLVQQDIACLAAALPSLASLETLNISKNYVSDEGTQAVTSALAHLSLKVLELSDVKLFGTKAVINGMKSFKLLEKLDLSFNHGGNFSIDVLNIEQYSFFSNLKVLSLSSNTMTPQDFGNLGRILFFCASLEELILDSNHIGNSIWLLCSLPRALYGLKTLSLANTGIWGSATEGLSCLLSNLRQLEVLNLSSNNLSSNDLRHLQPALSNLIHLRVFNVSENPGGSSILENVVPFVKSLEELIAGNTHLDGDGVKTIAPVIASFKSLKRLDLSNNMIGSVGANAIAQMLPSLLFMEDLDLSRTDICDEAMYTICVAINSALKSLSIGGNQIGFKTVTALCTLNMLEKLNLGDCGLDVDVTKALFDRCVSLKHLKRLDVSNNTLGESGTLALARALPSMISLEEFYCRWSIKNVDENSAENLCAAMIPLKYLKKLDLTMSRIGSTGGAALADLLPSLQLLEELVLCDIGLNEDSAPKLCDAMVSLKYLKKLCLSGDKIGSTGAAALAEVLPSLQLLEELVLREIDLDKDSAPKLFAAMVSLKYVKKLDISENEIGSTGAAALADVLRSLQLLEELRLWEINLDEDSAPKLCAAMGALKYLKKLCLSMNNIGSTGAAALADVLPSLQLLEELLLYDIGLDEYSAPKLCSAMVSLKCVKNLDLSSNEIGSTGAAALAGVLPSLQFLEELTLCDIELDEDSAPKLFAAMVALKYLKNLYLSNNEIGSTGAAALAGVLQSLQSLENLGLENINLDEDSAPKLCAAMVSLKFVKKLQLGENKLGSTGAAVLTDVLSSLPLLKSLSLFRSGLNEADEAKLRSELRPGVELSLW